MRYGLLSRVAPFVRTALVNGAAGVAVAPRGRPIAVIGITVECGKIAGGDVHVAPGRLGLLDSTRS